ncbi:MAG: TonB-dependent receptor [Alphaproteobacteria bacterium]
MPGIDILQSSSTTFDVGVRGYQQPYQPRLLVLVDGRQAFIDDYARTIWDNIPVNIDDIRQIEVVKGASSALFGSNAAGGVVNIITYSPLYDNDNVASLSYGTQNTLSGSATATVKLKNWGGVKITAGGMNANEFNTPRSAADTSLAMDPSHRYLMENSVFQLTPELQAQTELTYSESRDIGAELLNSLASQVATTYSVRGGLGWQTPYGYITSNNYLNHTRLQLHFGRFGTHPAHSAEVIISQLQDQFKLGNDHTVRLALEYQHRTFRMDTPSTPIPQMPVTDQDDYAVSGTWLWQISDKWSWTNAARFDHQDQAQTGELSPDDFVTTADYSHALNAFSANSALIYEATHIDTFRLSYGRGLQIPSLVQVGYITNASVGPLVFGNEGNPKLQPTVVTNYQLGYDRKLADIFSTVKASVFYEMNENATAINPVFATRVVNGLLYSLIQDINVGDSQAFGGEIALKGSHPSGFRWAASWSYSRVYDSALVAATLNYAGSAPRSHFRLTGGYTTGPWEFDVNAQLLTSSNMLGTSAAGVTGPMHTDGYGIVGGRLGYNVNDHFSVSLSGTNLNRRVLDMNPYPAIERQVFLTLTGKF